MVPVALLLEPLFAWRGVALALAPVGDPLTPDQAGAVGGEAILDIARSYGLETVGEGIEHSSQAHELQDIGCRFGQGYLFSPPLAAEDVGVFLRSATVGARRLVAV